MSNTMAPGTRLGSLRNPGAARRRRHGRGLSRARRAPRSRRRDQGAADEPRAGRGSPARFQREARAAGQLSHPNVMAIFDVGDGQVPYFVCELLEGVELRARLDGGPLPPKKAMSYAIQIARGLAAAHEKGFAHRDLKPENVMILRRRPREDPRLRPRQGPRARGHGGGADRAASDRAHDDRHDPRHRELHVARADPRAARPTTAPTCSRSARSSTRC